MAISSQSWTKHFELGFFITKTFLQIIKQGWQNDPHSQSACLVPGPYETPGNTVDVFFFINEKRLLAVQLQEINQWSENSSSMHFMSFIHTFWHHTQHTWVAQRQVCDRTDVKMKAKEANLNLFAPMASLCQSTTCMKQV